MKHKDIFSSLSPQEQALRRLEIFEQKLATSHDVVTTAKIFHAQMQKWCEKHPELNVVFAKLSESFDVFMKVGDIKEDKESAEFLKNLAQELIHETRGQLGLIVIDEMRLENAQLREKNQAFQAEITQLQAQLQALGDENAELKAKIEELLAIITDLQKEIAQLHLQLQNNPQDEGLLARIQELKNMGTKWIRTLAKQATAALTMTAIATQSVSAGNPLPHKMQLASISSPTTSAPSPYQSLTIKEKPSAPFSNAEAITQAVENPDFFDRPEMQTKLFELNQKMATDPIFDNLKYKPGQTWQVRNLVILQTLFPGHAFDHTQQKIIITKLQTHLGAKKADGEFGRGSRDAFVFEVSTQEAKFIAQKLVPRAPRLAEGQLADLSSFTQYMTFRTNTPYVHTEVLEEFLSLAIAYKKITGKPLIFESLYRTPQQKIKADVKAAKGDSLHNIARAADIPKYIALSPVFQKILARLGFIAPVADKGDHGHIALASSCEKFPAGTRFENSKKIQFTLQKEELYQAEAQILANLANQHMKRSQPNLKLAALSMPQKES